MAICPDCGSPVHFGALDGERIPLDDHEVMRGAHRLVERTGRLVPVSPTADVLAFTDHRKTCPKKR